MKKLAAIFLFSLFLANVIGYRIVYYYAQQQADKQFEVSLDTDQYDEADLLTLKVPLALPYQNDWADFERVDGEITFHGKIYKYVKRKITEGNLVLLCLPDYNKMRLKKEKDDFYKDANTLAVNTGTKKQENSKGSSLKNMVSEYDKFSYVSEAPVLTEHLSHRFSLLDAPLFLMPHSSPDRPPEGA